MCQLVESYLKPHLDSSPILFFFILIYFRSFLLQKDWGMIWKNHHNYFYTVFIMNIKTTGFALMAIVFGLALAPITINQADAIANPPNNIGNATPDTFFLRGDLTAPAGEAPFGGYAVGDYLIRANGEKISILTDFSSPPSEGMVFEGWLVDMATGYKLSLGQADATNHLFFSQTIVNPWIYEF